MNTKIFLLFLVLHLVPLSVSSVINAEKQMDKKELTAVNDHSGVSEPHSRNTSSAEYPLDLIHKRHGHHPEEDGKHHHIHFERFLTRKWRLVFCFIGKMILVVTYLCSLTSFYAQYL